MHLTALEEGAHRQCMDVAAVLLTSRRGGVPPLGTSSELHASWFSHIHQSALFYGSPDHCQLDSISGSTRLSSGAALMTGFAATAQVDACCVLLYGTRRRAREHSAASLAPLAHAHRPNARLPEPTETRTPVFHLNCTGAVR